MQVQDTRRRGWPKASSSVAKLEARYSGLPSSQDPCRFVPSNLLAGKALAGGHPKHKGGQGDQ